MQHPVFVSVVVTLYNKERYVQRALQSILAQTYPHFEIVVINDGSTDGSAGEVAALHDARIRLITQPNAGEGAARNRGIQESRGTLITMLDADDEWQPEFLQAVVDLNIAYPQAGIMATGYQTIHSPGFAVETTLSRDLFGGRQSGLVHDYFRLARQGYFVWSSAQAVPKHVYDAVGIFAVGEPMGPDLDMWGRIALRYPVAYDVRPLALYRNDATGRIVTQYKRKPTFPPFVKSARRALAENAVPADAQAPLKEYLNHLILQYLDRVVAAGDRRGLQQTLAAEFYPSALMRFRAELAYLRIASRVVPMRVLYFVQRLRRSRYVAFLFADRRQPVQSRVVKA